MHRWWILLAGCSEYDLQGGADTNGPGQECSTASHPAGQVEVDEACAQDDVGTFEPEVLWENNADFGGLYAYLPSVPLVGHLNDDNGDGHAGLGDIPDIVVTRMDGDYNPVLYAVQGATGELLWSVALGSAHLLTPALGDLDGDGTMEIVGEGDGNIKVLNGADGSLQWQAPLTYVPAMPGGGAIALADMDNDGQTEIIHEGAIYDGLTGGVLGVGAYGVGYGQWNAFPIVADVNGDGEQELVSGNAAYSIDGTVVWYNGGPDGYPAVGNFDDDDRPEIVVTGGGQVRLLDDDGTLLWAEEANTWAPGTPTIADFDGDGEAEIGFASANAYTVVDGDGSELWSRNAQDGSSFTASSVFDFEGDGRAEVIYADEIDLWVLDGETGSTRLQYEPHSSGTASEYPVIADVNVDGHADIVFVGSNYWLDDQNARLTVITDADRSWRPTRQIWNQHAYSITNINDDGTIPADPEPNWLTYNNFRSGDISAGGSLLQADAVPLVAETCDTECYNGSFELVVQVGNPGVEALPPGIPVSVYGVLDGLRTHLATLTVPDAIDSGASSPGLAFEIPFEAGAYDALEVVVDDDNGSGQLFECDESNNSVELTDGLCP